MIAVSQNLALRIPVATLGGAATASEFAANGFLQAFNQIDTFAAADDAPAPCPESHHGVADDAADNPDVETTPDPNGMRVEIWQPLVQVAATALGTTKDQAASLSVAQLTTAQLQQDPVSPDFSGLPTVDPEQPPENPRFQPIKTAPAPKGDAGLQQNPGTEALDVANVETEVAILGFGQNPLDDTPLPQDASAIQVPKQVARTSSAAVGPNSETAQTTIASPAQGKPASIAGASVEAQRKTQSEQPSHLGPVTKMNRSERETPFSLAVQNQYITSAETVWRQKWDNDLQASLVEKDPTRSGTIATGATGSPPPAAAPIQANISLGNTLTPPLQTSLADGSNGKAGQHLPWVVHLLPPSLSEPTSDQITAGAVPLPASDRLVLDSFSPERLPGDGSGIAVTQGVPSIVSTVLPPLSNPGMPGFPASVTPTIVKMSKSGDDGPLELALSPEELGRLTISITQDGDFVHVSVIADRPETLDLMRRHAGDLVADLRQSGFSGASLSFGQDQQPRSANARPAEKNQPTPHQQPPETKPTAPNRSQKGSGMDVRI